jgi:hypothetical protein
MQEDDSGAWTNRPEQPWYQRKFHAAGFHWKFYDVIL